MVLQDAPAGFESAAAVLNSLPQDYLAQTCQEVLSFLQYKVGCVNVKKLRTQLDGAGCSLTQEKLQSAVNALTFVFRSAAQEHVAVDALSEELGSSNLFSEEAVAIIKHLWSEEGKSLLSPDVASRLLNVGHLVGMKWKLGVAMSSSSCRSLNTPYVTMVLSVGDASGLVRDHSFELSIAEFQNFSKQVKEMGAILETV
ncbi:COMM domain-containing protein 6-like [Corticium candelabrum]|uniref:COMM domain-containing protein 6-like n=1 Tax=Corticium candelabrum TaxID=121492 RepID=UPI002E33EE3B|nr:COMM domain-containing protein 6-like [Corticium candelabrum]